MNLNIKGKTALITGSTVGIGFSIAESLYHEGAKVIVNGRSEARVNEAVKKLKDGEGWVEGIVADLTTKKGQETLFKKLPEVDILINNLGIYEAKSFDQISPEDWTKLFETNVVSGAVISQYYLPKMKEKNWGRIVFIASESGVNIPSEMIHYGVSKAAQIALARGIAETTAGTGVTVNSVLPGPTYSEGINTFLDAVIQGDARDRKAIEKEFLLKVRPTSLLKRFATGEEVANLVTYLSSPLSSATNGASLRVEGGLLRSV